MAQCQLLIRLFKKRCGRLASLVASAPLCRAQAKVFSEYPGEIAGVMVTAAPGDFGDGQAPGALIHEQAGGLVKADAGEAVQKGGCNQ